MYEYQNFISLLIVKKKEIVYNGQIYNIGRFEGFYTAGKLENDDYIIISGKLKGKILSELQKEGYNNFCINPKIAIEQMLQLYDLPGNYFKFDSEGHISAIEDENLLSFVKKVYGLDVEQVMNEKSNIPSSTDVSEIERMYKTITESILFQDDKVQQILASIYFNNKLVNSDLDISSINNLKNRIIIDNDGEKSCGETEILRMCSKAFNLPIFIVDCNEEYPEDEEIVRKLLNQTSGNFELAEKGIVVYKNLSDTDFCTNGKPDFFFDSDKVFVDGKQFETSKLTMVATGNFEDLDDYMDYFNCRVCMAPIIEDDYKYIAKQSKLSPLNGYKTMFEQLGMEFECTEKYLENLNENYSFSTIEDYYMQITTDINEKLYEIMSGKCKEVILDTRFDENDVEHSFVKIIR